jgi:hypothetical protein
MLGRGGRCPMSVVCSPSLPVAGICLRHFSLRLGLVGVGVGSWG